MAVPEARSLFDVAFQYPLITVSLATLGALSLTNFFLSVSRVLFQTFVLQGISLKKYGAKGSWAVVTGATDGIGKEFANQLAKAGFNVLLVSRNPEKLDAASSEIEAKYGVQTKTQAIDFSAPDEKDYQGLASLISGLEIGILVNNVGRSHDFPVYFQDTTQEAIREIIDINVKATLRVTSIVLPSLVARKKGLILNIGSFAAAVPSPMLATYAGAKAFIATWSQALGEELKSTGVLVQLVNTFWVVSAMSKIRKPSALVPLPNTYVRAVLSRIGVPCGAFGSPYYTTPYWAHSMVDFVLRQVGQMGIYMMVIHGMHKDLRARALRKLAREAKSQ